MCQEQIHELKYNGVQYFTSHLGIGMYLILKLLQIVCNLIQPKEI